MALAIFPIGLMLGWLIRRPRWAAAVTVAVGVMALTVLAILALLGFEISPLETMVLLVGTPIAAALAFKIARHRRIGRLAAEAARRRARAGAGTSGGVVS